MCTQLVCALSAVYSTITNSLLVINKTQTRLDPHDPSLWRDAGLYFNDQGCIVPSNVSESGFSEDGENMTQEDITCNTLVWLQAKLVNLIAPCHYPQSKSPDCWHGLQQQFQTWYRELPITFQPTARIETSKALGQFEEIWYSMPMCASAMQSFHMSQILLLMNKPHESTQGLSTVCATLNSYQSVLMACQQHSREIIGISLARLDDAVRIHSVQPIFTAGQCFHDPRERQVVVNLLRDIETDIGWATDYRVRQLAEQWQWQGQVP